MDGDDLFHSHRNDFEPVVQLLDAVAEFRFRECAYYMIPQLDRVLVPRTMADFWGRWWTTPVGYKAVFTPEDEELG
jgi:hypothetical protein